jgi:hypothetical protein
VPPRKARGALDQPFRAVPDLGVSGRGTPREIFDHASGGSTRDIGISRFPFFPFYRFLFLSLYLFISFSPD